MLGPLHWTLMTSNKSKCMLIVTLGKCTWLTGYIILYTTNASSPDAEWTVKGILGEASNATIVGLTPNTYYHFKVFNLQHTVPVNIYGFTFQVARCTQIEIVSQK